MRMHRLSALHSSSKSGASGCKKGCEKETSNASNNYNENRSFPDVFFAETSWNHAGESIVPLPNTAKVGQRTKELSDHSDFGVVQTESNS